MKRWEIGAEDGVYVLCDYLVEHLDRFRERVHVVSKGDQVRFYCFLGAQTVSVGRFRRRRRRHRGALYSLVSRTAGLFGAGAYAAPSCFGTFCYERECEGDIELKEGKSCNSATCEWVEKDAADFRASQDDPVSVQFTSIDRSFNSKLLYQQVSDSEDSRQWYLLTIFHRLTTKANLLIHHLTAVRPLQLPLAPTRPHPPHLHLLLRPRNLPRPNGQT